MSLSSCLARSVLQTTIHTQTQIPLSCRFHSSTRTMSIESGESRFQVQKSTKHEQLLHPHQTSTNRMNTIQFEENTIWRSSRIQLIPNKMTGTHQMNTTELTVTNQR
ncbi:hypothetical protein BLNAU_22366 [Blattamonas nauphoetae]|uniref:Uncharacterized protein n=1 Tax=Blattamonas nauphoetae TaxID=2049346 RepID=A0ABQ9WT95_9EUKA|nr:hypothetical protein BLNAU_22366 [Blattamonas nauphoetae]